MKLAAFDLEIAKALPDESTDWHAHGPLGIGCAAIALNDPLEVEVHYNQPQLSRRQAEKLVERLVQIEKEGYTLITWNGCSFDFRVLAEESGRVEQCTRLALSHVDLMLYVTFSLGWYLGLDSALAGASLSGKKKAITLSDGTQITNMDGSKAPELWQRGEIEAVIEYLKEDVRQELALAEWVARRGEIRWTSRSGRPWRLSAPHLPTVRECLSLPEPDTSWMSDPPRRERFTEWFSPRILG